MAHDHLLLAPVTLLALLLGAFLLIIQSDPAFAHISQLFWVAADRVQCSIYSNSSDCDTLEGYLKRDDVNFSLSDTTWIFLHGNHVPVSDWSLQFVGMRNVTLKGEDKCATGTEDCILMLNPHVTEIFIWESSHVTIEGLKLRHAFITVGQTNNLYVRAVDFQSSIMRIKNPIGNYTIMESTFGPSSYVCNDLISCPYAAAENCNFSFTLKQLYQVEPENLFCTSFGRHQCIQHKSEDGQATQLPLHQDTYC